jgi:phenylpropionate dioxygenase-like ring-hydroxylating dioxygenase large terminal subunit
MKAAPLADDATVVQRILDHIDRRTTDLASSTWREPLDHYRSPPRFAKELELLRRWPIPFCPSAALPEVGSFVEREAAGVPIVAVRGRDGAVRAFLNACSHRGAQVARGSGCVKSLVCPYHGWTYALEGDLRGVPHEHGFPGLDKAKLSLAPFAAVEHGGVVFVSQQSLTPDRAEELAALPVLVSEKFRLVSRNALDVPANWKIAVEGFLEGYHIRATHPKTFYPVQYDNLNVIEAFGRNSRVTFPYRNVESQRAVEASRRSGDGRLTHVYHLFRTPSSPRSPGASSWSRSSRSTSRRHASSPTRCRITTTAARSRTTR